MTDQFTITLNLEEIGDLDYHSRKSLQDFWKTRNHGGLEGRHKQRNWIRKEVALQRKIKAAYRARWSFNPATKIAA